MYSRLTNASCRAVITTEKNRGTLLLPPIDRFILSNETRRGLVATSFCQDLQEEIKEAAVDCPLFFLVFLVKMNAAEFLQRPHVINRTAGLLICPIRMQNSPNGVDTTNNAERLSLMPSI